MSDRKQWSRFIRQVSLENYLSESKVLEAIIIKHIVSSNDIALLENISAKFFNFYPDIITRLKKINGVVSYATVVETDIFDNVSKNIIYSIRNSEYDSISAERAVYRLKEISFLINIQSSLEDIINNLNSRDLSENYIRLLSLSKNIFQDYSIEENKGSIKPIDFINTVRNKKKNVAQRISTGIKSLDYKLFGGFASGDIIVIAAQPGGGKTALCLNMFIHNEEKFRADNKICIFFSLDMNPMSIYYRMISRKFNVDYNEAQKICLEEDVQKYVLSLPIVVFSQHSVNEIDSIIASQSERVGLVVIDYIQLVVSTADTINNKITDFISKIKQSITSINCPIIFISQMNRNYARRIDGTVQLADLKDSSAIEQAADLVLFMSSDNDESSMSSINIYVAKNRNGPCGNVSVGFRKAFYLFTDLPNIT